MHTVVGTRPHGPPLLDVSYPAQLAVAPSVDLGSVRLEGLKKQDRGTRAKSRRPRGTGVKEALESDLTSKLEATTSQTLPFFEFPCLQSDFTTSESC